VERCGVSEHNRKDDEGDGICKPNDNTARSSRKRRSGCWRPSGKQAVEIERELGLPYGLIRKCQRRFQVNAATDMLELSEVEQLKAEVRALKGELDITRMERDILKKR
jgi:hypothetical protein